MAISFSPSLPSPSPLFSGGRNVAEARQFRLENGIPERVHAAYAGPSGPKDHHFPVSPDLDLSEYPDITGALETFKAEVLEEVRAINKGPLGLVRTFRLFADNFPTAEAWDTKYQPMFPGRDNQGRTQYALYKGKVVSANYISNNFYAQIAAAIGLPLWFTKLAAHMDACGLAEVVFLKKVPESELRSFRDTVEDQDALVSGYDDYRNGDPWRQGFDPKRPYPKAEITDMGPVGIRGAGREGVDLVA